MARKTVEASFKKQILDLARLYDWLVYSIPDSRFATLAGFPDLVLMRERDSRLMFVELKTDVGRLSPQQKVVLALLERIADANQTIQVHVWRPRDWESVQKFLRH